VQKRLTAGVGGHLQIGGNLALDLSVGYQRVRNAGNRADVDQSGAFFQVKLAALIWKTFRV